MKLIIQTGIQIQKPINEIFDAIVNPEIMKNYFISDSTGKLEKGKEVIWSWPEYPNNKTIVNQIEISPNQSISFVWDNATRVTIQLQELTNNSVIVLVSEGEKESDEKGIKWFGGNTEGWANFLACLKAYLEFGINLRKNSFDYRNN